MSHTKGEWKQFAPHIKDSGVDETYRRIEAGYGFYDQTSGTGFSLTNYISKADAQLIAAAPDLLDALDRVLASMSLERTENFELLERCKNAIQKAKGL